MLWRKLNFRQRMRVVTDGIATLGEDANENVSADDTFKQIWQYHRKLHTAASFLSIRLLMGCTRLMKKTQTK